MTPPPPSRKGEVLVAVMLLGFLAAAPLLAQEPLRRVSAAGSIGSATQMALWFAKEGRFFEKYGLAADVVNIQTSPLTLSALLAGEIQVAQIGGPAPIFAKLSGADLVIVATIVRNFVFSLVSRSEINNVRELKGRALGVSRFGALSDFAARFALQKNGLQPDRDISVVQTGGQAETVAALGSGRINAAALTAPSNILARKAGFKELLDISKLEADTHVNGLVVTRKYLSGNEETVRRFLKAYMESVALAKKDKSFAIKAMARYLRTDDQESLNESYEWIIKQNFVVAPYPAVAGIGAFLDSAKKTNPKAAAAKPEDFVDGRLVKELDDSGFSKSLLR
jgi:ABC-type nitrate/sulfonate/bicarbonate transport system substrate-binding protein